MKYVCFKFLSFNEYPQTAYVGAYRIRPNAHTYLRGCFQGVRHAGLQIQHNNFWQFNFD